MNESKRRVTDIESLRHALVGDGWSRASFATETDLYYRKEDGTLGRIRSCGSFTEVAVESGERHILTVPSQSGDLHELTDGWPAKPFAKVEKTRTSYLSESFPGVRVDLDCIPGTGMFVKIRSALDPFVVEQLEVKLGLDHCESTQEPYRDLVAR